MFRFLRFGTQFGTQKNIVQEKGGNIKH